MIGALLWLASKVLGFAKARTDAATQVKIEGIQADTDRTRLEADVIRARMGNPLVNFAAGIMSLAAAVYFLLIIVDTIWQLPGDIDALPATTAAVMATVIGGLFLKSR